MDSSSLWWSLVYLTGICEVFWVTLAACKLFVKPFLKSMFPSILSNSFAEIFCGFLQKSGQTLPFITRYKKIFFC